MANLDALRDAVVAAPVDDAPRVAYADAIASTDPDRAEFIRLQLALARWRKTHEDPPERVTSSTRSRNLLDRHERAWSADVRPLVDECGFLRGFVELVELDAAKFLATAPELYRRAPILHLELTGVKAVAAQLFASPHLDRIESLSLLRNKLDDADAAVLASSPHLGRLAWLDVGLNAIGPAGLEALAASMHLPRLGYVGLAGNPVDDPTPRHADGYEHTSAAAEALMAKHGRRAWLDATQRPVWPPDRDAVDAG